eukprot:m.134872 g.134872  ORF g.134872 m.134872 type:complete len:447 (+) comp13889_c0_seq1:247-1587(+)
MSAAETAIPLEKSGRCGRCNCTPSLPASVHRANASGTPRSRCVGTAADTGSLPWRCPKPCCPRPLRPPKAGPLESRAMPLVPLLPWARRRGTRAGWPPPSTIPRLSGDPRRGGGDSNCSGTKTSPSECETSAGSSGTGGRGRGRSVSLGSDSPSLIASTSSAMTLGGATISTTGLSRSMSVSTRPESSDFGHTRYSSISSHSRSVSNSSSPSYPPCSVGLTETSTCVGVIGVGGRGDKQPSIRRAAATRSSGDRGIPTPPSIPLFDWGNKPPLPPSCSTSVSEPSQPEAPNPRCRPCVRRGRPVFSCPSAARVSLDILCTAGRSEGSPLSENLDRSIARRLEMVVSIESSSSKVRFVFGETSAAKCIPYSNPSGPSSRSILETPLNPHSAVGLSLVSQLAILPSASQDGPLASGRERCPMRIPMTNAGRVAEVWVEVWLDRCGWKR